MPSIVFTLSAKSASSWNRRPSTICAHPPLSAGALTTSSLLPPCKGASINASWCIASGFATSICILRRVELTSPSSGLALRTAKRGCSSPARMSISTLSNKHAASFAHSAICAATPSSKQLAENCPLLSEKSISTNRLPLRESRQRTPSIKAAIVAGLRTPSGIWPELRSSA